MTTMKSAFQDRILAGKTAFITGGTSGINLGIARRFVAAGAKVTVLGRKVEKAAAARAELEAIGGVGCALEVIADVRQPDAMIAAFATAVEKFGELDILIAGAAGNFPAPALAMSPNAFKSVIDIDVLGTFNAARLGYEHLRKPGASIINISAPQAGLAALMQSHVCAAKAGVDMVTKTLAMEWGPMGVRVNSIWPGAVAGTEGFERLAPSDDIRTRMASLLPLQSFATPEDIAELALFLSTDSARYITGSILQCDGGLSLVGFTALMGQ
jgi:NAD(P)-dependent dehydrogenase (short-subunit alcohol dehydrogenase family)